MKVNAQVTAVTTSFEALGNVVIVIIRICSGLGAVRRVWSSHLWLGLILYFVLLPFLFLMNTKHNKNRVIEEGWQNVFKNVFRICGIALPSNGNEIENIRGENAEPTPSSSSGNISSRIKMAKVQSIKLVPTRDEKSKHFQQLLI